ncbi:MAG: hypothetical protein KDK71_09810 [Chlamydiia bacterium]|nr:hypothetical protein [Chlamydiia bacterium]
MTEELITGTLAAPERIVEDTSHTPYGYLHQLEQNIVKTWPNAKRLIPYLDEIRKALDENDKERALACADDLEEMMDLDLTRT